MTKLDNNEQAVNLLHNVKGSIENKIRTAYNLGYQDGLKVGKQIVLGAFETFVNADRKTEPQTELVRVKYHCINCAENGSYKCSKCDGEMYYKYDKDEPQTSGTPYKIEPSSVCKDEPQKWETPPKFEHKGIITTCVSVPACLLEIEDEPQTECYFRTSCDHYGDKQVCGRCREYNLYSHTKDGPHTERCK